jgi:hypothetical protein
VVDLSLFERLLRDEVTSRASFDENWPALKRDYTAWLETPVARNTSELNQRLELMRRIAAVFGVEILKSAALVEAALAGTANVGDWLIVPFNQRREEVKVVGRSVTDRFTVMYVLERSNGRRFSYEFYD